MSGVVPVLPRFRFFDKPGGNVLDSGFVTVYAAGTTTKVNTYQDKALTALNTNPIELDADGECLIFTDGTVELKFLLQDKHLATVTGWPVDNIQSNAAANFLQAGTGAVVRPMQAKLREIVSLDDYFVAGAADDTLALQAAVTAAGSGGVVNLNRTCIVSSTGAAAIQVSAKNVTISGGKQRAALRFTGTGAVFQLGTDNGLALDGGQYDGTAQGFRLEKVDMVCLNDGTAGKPRTALLNSISSQFYGAGTYGILDWRGGSTRVEHCTIQGFEYGYWGVQADINAWYEVTMAYNHVAVFLGPRCDQGVYDHTWTFGNDTVWLLEGARHNRISHWITDTDGSATTAPADVHNSEVTRNARYTGGVRTQAGNVFEQPWCEQLGSLGSVNPGYDVPYVFDLGFGDGTVGGGVTIRDPICLVNLYSNAALPHFLYLVRACNVKSVDVVGMRGAANNIPWTNMRSVFYVDATAAATARVIFSDADMAFSARLIESYNALSTFVQIRSDGFGQTYTINTVGGTGPVNIGGLGLHRLLTHNNAPSTGGTAGDIVLNRTFSYGKSLGWVTNASSASVIPNRTISVNRGNTDVTLTPETDQVVQPFTTALTADRTVTLAAAPNASTFFYTFRIVRSAAGAFNLNVHNLTGGGTLLKAMAAGTWADYEYDATGNWMLTATGSL